jgi:hypothetical protein
MRIGALIGTAILMLLGGAGPASSAIPEMRPRAQDRSIIDSASYTVGPESGDPDTDFVATLRNDGLSTIEYGNPYRLVVRRGGRWAPVPLDGDCAFTMEAHQMAPGGSDSQEVSSGCLRAPLEPGRYRVSKRIRFTDAVTEEYRPATVRAFFRVRS